LFEKCHIYDLIAFAAGKTQSVIEEDLKALVFVVQDFAGLEVSLRHTGFCYVCGLVLRHEV